MGTKCNCTFCASVLSLMAIIVISKKTNAQNLFCFTRAKEEKTEVLELVNEVNCCQYEKCLNFLSFRGGAGLSVARGTGSCASNETASPLTSHHYCTADRTNHNQLSSICCSNGMMQLLGMKCCWVISLNMAPKLMFDRFEDGSGFVFWFQIL